MQEKRRAMMKRRTLVLLLAGVLLAAAVAVLSRASEGKDWKRAQEWVDYLQAPEEFPQEELSGAAYRELELSEFPGVTFIWNGGAVKARTGEEEMLLFFGMPVYNVFLCDLTGDGLPEFCATAAFGSGMVDNHIIVCDYAAAVENPKPEPQEGELYAGEAQYFLWNRGEYNYTLSLEKGRLMVTKSEYWGEVISTGTLAIGGEGQLVMAEERPAAGDYSGASLGTGASDQLQPVSKGREPSTLVPDQVDSIWMTVEKSSVSPHGLLYLIHNETGEELVMGERYFLQAEDGGQWYDVEAKEGGEIYFLDMAWILDGRERTVQSFRAKWDDWYGPLPAGHYRVVAQVNHGAERTELTLAAEFDIDV